MTSAKAARICGITLSAAVSAVASQGMSSPLGAVELQSAKRSCLSAGETREVVAARKLTAPVAALRTAGSHAHGETLTIRLCRISDDLVYEVTVLRRDGRVVKVVVDATTGKIVRTLNDR
jgi:uncharacterized membrane protein YkoI